MESMSRSIMVATLPSLPHGISSSRRITNSTTNPTVGASLRNNLSEEGKSSFVGISFGRSSYVGHVCRADSLGLGAIRVTTDLDIGAVDHGIWERVQLLERQLGVAVAEESYAGATRIRDQLANLKSRLTPGEQFLLTNSTRARTGSLGQRMTALAAMGELGDHRALPVLLEGLRDKNPFLVEQTEKAMWKIFMRSGREDIDQKLQDGVELLTTKDGYRKAKNILTEIINEAPSFAEGFNKRATVNYLLEEYDEAIKDCYSTLELNPYHFGALSGMGLCYAARRELESALFWFEKAVALHPGLYLIIRYIEALKQKIAHEKGNVEDDEK
ncbi:hypothetical protein KC19_12G142700 [Ceratodon purpureus]|uniref:Uncharacterized protein n=1 Tax=Ceratodon purpureus TaxID=3225 RepID=A0A8T0GB62_CERPU|nr:hypothetical protein KC19_12G142700 [Ceratodon purpureus]